MAEFVFTNPINDASSVLSSSHSTGDGILTVSDPAPFGSPSPSAPIRVTVSSPDGSVWSIFKITGITGSNLTISSAIEGTADQNFAVNSLVQMLITAGYLSDIHTAVNTGSLAIGNSVYSGVNNSVLYGDSSGNLAQSANLVWNNSTSQFIVSPSGSEKFRITSTGIGVGGITSPGAQLDIQWTSIGTIGQRLHLTSGQTADAFQVLDNNSNVLIKVDHSGNLSFADTKVAIFPTSTGTYHENLTFGHFNNGGALFSGNGTSLYDDIHYWGWNVNASWNPNYDATKPTWYDSMESGYIQPDGSILSESNLEGTGGSASPWPALRRWRTFSFNRATGHAGWGYFSDNFELMNNSQSQQVALFGSLASGRSSPLGVYEIEITNGGSGFTDGSNYTLSFSGGGGTGAQGVFDVSGGKVTSIWLQESGYNYTSNPTLDFSAAGAGSGVTTSILLGSITLNLPVICPMPISAGQYWLCDGSNGYQGFLAGAVNSNTSSVYAGYNVKEVSGSYEYYSTAPLSAVDYSSAGEIKFYVGASASAGTVISPTHQFLQGGSVIFNQIQLDTNAALFGYDRNIGGPWISYNGHWNTSTNRLELIDNGSGIAMELTNTQWELLTRTSGNAGDALLNIASISLAGVMSLSGGLGVAGATAPSSGAAITGQVFVNASSAGSASAQLEVHPASASTVGQAIYLAATPSGDAFRVIDSSSNVITKVDSTGALAINVVGTTPYLQELQITSAGTSGVGLRMIATSTGGRDLGFMSTAAGAGAGSGKLAFVDFTGGTYLGYFDSSSHLVINAQASGTANAQLEVHTASATTVGQAIYLSASQSSDAFQVLDSSNNKQFRIQANGALSGTIDTMTYATAISLDTTKGNLHKTTTVDATGNATINASDAGIAGQQITILIANDATSGKTITFGTNFKSSGTLTGTISKSATVSFWSDGTSWYESGRVTSL